MPALNGINITDLISYGRPINRSCCTITQDTRTRCKHIAVVECKLQCN